MSVSTVHGAIHPLRTGHRPGEGSTRDPFERMRVGESLSINVVRRLDQRTYLVSFGGEQHVMESSVHLAVGGRVRAVVVAVGDRLELRYVDTAAQPVARSEEPFEASREELTNEAALVSGLEARYRVNLVAGEHAQLEDAVSQAADPVAMALGGFYLAKLGVPMNPIALGAMHDVQRESSIAVTTPAGAQDISALVDGAMSADDSSTRELARILGDSVPDRAAQALSFAGGDSGDSGSGAHDAHDLAKLFLNLQDGGSIGYRYGTLPVIVAGQLVELDLVVLRQREQPGAGSSVRRLVMTLKTESFGQVRIDARALENRLVVTFASESPRAADGLASHGDELRDLLQRLGWNVEGIAYELDAQPGRAARSIIDHVLSAGTVDLVF
jgi:hypothetical protein